MIFDNKNAYSRSFIVLKNQYGIIVHFTCLHNYVDAYERGVCVPLASDAKSKMYYICKMLNYILIDNYEAFGNGCPYCAGKKVLAGFNDLKTLNSRLADEWDYEKNELLPSQVTVSSQKSIWWKCKLGHSWKASVAARSRGDSCPYCSGKKVLKGFNDLETLNPKFLKEWDCEKNILLPSEVTRCSGKMVWWKCELGHSWKIKVSSRANGSGCPYCCNQKILPGFNDLKTLNAQLADEWDFEKNTLKPSHVALQSNLSAWWKCSEGHSFKAIIAGRSSGGNGCPCVR